MGDNDAQRNALRNAVSEVGGLPHGAAYNLRGKLMEELQALGFKESVLRLSVRDGRVYCGRDWDPCWSPLKQLDIYPVVEDAEKAFGIAQKHISRLPDLSKVHEPREKGDRKSQVFFVGSDLLVELSLHKYSLADYIELICEGDLRRSSVPVGAGKGG